jgi:hypothetical protein
MVVCEKVRVVILIIETFVRYFKNLNENSLKFCIVN